MIKMILVFLFLFISFFIGINLFRTLNGKGKWVLTKLIGYSAVCALLSVAVLVIMVVLF